MPHIYVLSLQVLEFKCVSLSNWNTSFVIKSFAHFVNCSTVRDTEFESTIIHGIRLQKSHEKQNVLLWRYSTNCSFILHAWRWFGECILNNCAFRFQCRLQNQTKSSKVKPSQAESSQVIPHSPKAWYAWYGAVIICKWICLVEIYHFWSACGNWRLPSSIVSAILDIFIKREWCAISNLTS